jgi:hypothetical protein
VHLEIRLISKAEVWGWGATTEVWLFQRKSRCHYRQVVDFQVTYFLDGFSCFSFLTQNFDIWESGRKKSHTMSPK